MVAMEISGALPHMSTVRGRRLSTPEQKWPGVSSSKISLSGIYVTFADEELRQISDRASSFPEEKRK